MSHPEGEGKEGIRKCPVPREAQGRLKNSRQIQKMRGSGQVLLDEFSGEGRREPS